jgi:hypothetical protein
VKAKKTPKKITRKKHYPHCAFGFDQKSGAAVYTPPNQPVANTIAAVDAR